MEFFKQIFTRNEWIHIHQLQNYPKNSMSDFGIILTNSVITFLIIWAISQQILVGLSVGVIFAILAMITCYCEFRKSLRIRREHI
jgi:hypothetical protein